MTGLVIYLLAVYGVSNLVASYDGLWHVFLRLRNRYPGSALTCAVCLSVYVSVILFILVLLGIGYMVLMPLAAIGAVILLKEVRK